MSWCWVADGTGNLWFFLVVLEPVLEKFGTEKSPETGLENFLVPIKVLEPVSENFGTEKSIETGLEKIWYRKNSRNQSRKILVLKKVSESVSFRFWVLSHTVSEQIKKWLFMVY